MNVKGGGGMGMWRGGGVGGGGGTGWEILSMVVEREGLEDERGRGGGFVFLI